MLAASQGRSLLLIYHVGREPTSTDVALCPANVSPRNIGTLVSVTDRRAVPARFGRSRVKVRGCRFLAERRQPGGSGSDGISDRDFVRFAGLPESFGETILTRRF